MQRAFALAQLPPRHGGLVLLDAIAATAGGRDEARQRPHSRADAPIGAVQRGAAWLRVHLPWAISDRGI
ncbi:hypothetical protein D9M68_882630 [compost metagenome]